MRPVTAASWWKAGISGIVAVALIGPATYAAALDGFDVSQWKSSESLRVQATAGQGVLSGVARRGGPFEDVNDLRLADADSVVNLEARVTVLDLDVVPAAGASSPQAGLAGCFYWDGSGSGLDGDWTGHVLAAVYLGSDGRGGVGARYAVTRCLDPDCSQAQQLAGGPVGSGAGRLFESRKLSLGYDGQAFTFRVDTTASIRVTAPGPKRYPTPNAFRALRTDASTAAGSEASARVLALFERIEVNGVLYDAFDAVSYPRVQIAPASGRLASTQSLDVVVLVEAGQDPIVGGRLLANGEDITASVGQGAVVEARPGGGAVVRFPGVPLGRILSPGQPVLLAAEVHTAGGAVGRDFALWERLDVTEP